MSALGQVDTDLEFPLLSPHRDPFSGQQSPGGIGTTHKDPIPVALSEQETMNPDSHFGDEEMEVQREDYCLKVTQLHGQAGPRTLFSLCVVPALPSSSSHSGAGVWLELGVVAGVGEELQSGEGKKLSLWCQLCLSSPLGSTPANCVTLGKLLNLSELQLPPW